MPAMRERMRAIGFGGLASAILAVGAGAAWVPAGLLGASGPAGSVLCLYTAGLLLLSVALPLVRRGVGRAQTRAAAALAMLAVAPLVALGVAYVRNQPLIESHWVCGTGTVGLFLAVPFVVSPIVAVLSTAAHAMLALGRRILSPIVAVGSLAAVIVAAIALVLARSQGNAPSPEEWLDQLPVIASFDTPASGTSAAVPVDGSTVATVSCGEGPDAWCDIALCHRSTSVDASCDESDTASVAAGRNVVKRDERHGLYVVESDVGGRIAFGPSLAPATVAPGDLADVVAPPRPYLWLAWVGVALAGLAILMRLRATWLRRRLAAGRDGLAEGQSVVFSDGALPRRSALRPAAVGPVVALSSSRAGPPTYRDEGVVGVSRPTPGTLTEVREALAMSALSWDAVALAAAVLTSLPLLA